MGDIRSTRNENAQELREIHDILPNLGLGINRVHDDSRINCVRVDANGHPNNQYEHAIQRTQLAYKNESEEVEEIMDYHKTNQRRSVGIT